MKAENHPEFQIEEGHLNKTLGALEAKLDRIAKSDRHGGDAHAHNALVDLAIAEYEQLQQARNVPYFGRIDFAEFSRPRVSHYIGTVGFEHDGCMVIEWRAPIATLFYQNRSGRTAYTSPDGLVRGTLSLKRSFEIKVRQLLSITDQFDARKEIRAAERVITDPDQYLQEVLQKRQDIQLRDIVATIQREQDAVIRAEARQVLVVQGVAGSGKTSIALHRLAYLLYPGNKSGITPARCIIFGPNRLFLNYIALVLPSLGVQDIPQATLADWEMEQIGQAGWKTTDTALDAIMSSAVPREEKVLQYRRSRLKGSAPMGQLMKKYLEHRRRISIPEGGLSYPEVGKLKVKLGLTTSQILETYNQFTTLPLHEHRKRFIEAITARIVSQYDPAVTQRARELAAPGEKLLETAQQLRHQAEQLDKWAEEVRATSDSALSERKTDDSLLQGAIGLQGLSDYYRRQGESIIRSAELAREDALERKTRRETTDQVERQVQREIDQFWSPLQLPQDYYALLANRVLLEELTQGMWAQDQIDLLHQEEPGDRVVDLSDLPAMFFLHTTASGMRAAPFEHIVVDEAQDVSPLEFETLRLYSRNGSMMILGDIAQSIYAHRGIANWDEIRNVLPNLKYAFQEITKSYRSTYEIMTLARRALLSVPRKGRPVALPEPLKRHGALPQLHSLQNTGELSDALTQAIGRIQEDGCRNIAIICKTSARCSVIADLLTLKSADFHLATSSDFKYEGGVVIVPVHLAKGMEFEASLVVDADAQTYTETEFDGRLLYVALTRALHVLEVFWIGQVSKHLEKVATPQD